MGDEFLADCLTLYIEQDLTLSIDIDSVIDEFETLKTRWAQLRKYFYNFYYVLM